MKIAHYIGDHSKDGLLARAGWAMTRLAQKGPYENVTHCEAILHEFDNGVVEIGSASLRDGGVRMKQTVLNPDHWMIVDVPAWSEIRSRKWFVESQGVPYDSRGAWALFLPGSADGTRQFCNKAVGYSVGVVAAETFSPATFAALTITFGSVVTARFFAERQHLVT